MNNAYHGWQMWSAIAKDLIYSTILCLYSYLCWSWWNIYITQIQYTVTISNIENTLLTRWTASLLEHFDLPPYLLWFVFLFCFCVVFCFVSLWIPFFFIFYGHRIICPSLTCGFWLPLLYFQTSFSEWSVHFLFFLSYFGYYYSLLFSSRQLVKWNRKEILWYLNLISTFSLNQIVEHVLMVFVISNLML